MSADGTPVTKAQAQNTAVPLGEISAIAPGGMTVTSNCGQLGQLATNTLCTAQTVATTPTVTFASTDASTSDGTSQGGSDSNSLTETTNGAPGSVTFTLTLPHPLPASATGTATLVITQTKATDLRVLQTAVRTGSNGSSWLLTTTNSRKKITLGLCAAGYCAVSGPGVHDGLLVQLSSLSTPAS